MSEVLTVKVRDSYGKRNNRRLRLAGDVPAILYGHGEANISLTVPVDALRAAIRHGTRVVDLQGAVQEKAFIRDLQWDTYGNEVLHLDLTRVSADEKLQVEVPVEVRGEAPGTRSGGIVEHVVHQVEIECLAIAIPEKLSINIKGLEVGQHLMAKHIELPAGVVLISDPEEIIVNCHLPREEGELAAPGTEGAEPEVIGRKAEDGEGEEA
jgi:large subunit ribosomal protein L25